MTKNKSEARWGCPNCGCEEVKFETCGVFIELDWEKLQDEELKDAYRGKKWGFIAAKHSKYICLNPKCNYHYREPAAESKEEAPEGKIPLENAIRRRQELNNWQIFRLNSSVFITSDRASKDRGGRR